MTKAERKIKKHNFLKNKWINKERYKHLKRGTLFYACSNHEDIYKVLWIERKTCKEEIDVFLDGPIPNWHGLYSCLTPFKGKCDLNFKNYYEIVNLMREFEID